MELAILILFVTFCISCAFTFLLSCTDYGMLQCDGTFEGFKVVYLMFFIIKRLCCCRVIFIDKELSY